MTRDRCWTAVAWLALALTFARTAAAEHWLAERAGSSDLVVVAQLERVDYEYARGFPVDGRAWFRPLIRYKPEAEGPDLLVVAERGMKEAGCYFPRTLPWNERPRYLLFLVADAERGELRGHADGCAIEILVEATGRYAARWPQPALGGELGRGDPVLRQRVREMTFQGPSARIDARDLLAHQRLARAQRDFMEVDGTDLVPTRGIALTELRLLMEAGLDADARGGRLRQRAERVGDGD